VCPWAGAALVAAACWLSLQEQVEAGGLWLLRHHQQSLLLPHLVLLGWAVG
jgi:hypothetical protein